jgi:hypothetical protein
MSRSQLINAQNWEELEVRNRRETEFEEDERYYFNSLDAQFEEEMRDMVFQDAEEFFAQEDERERSDLPTIRLESIFDLYSLSEEDWDDLWNNRPRQLQIESKNPKIGDITTITFIVNDETETKLKTDEFDCPICYASVFKWDAVHMNCAHAFCGSCISNHLESLHNNHKLVPSCALCRTEYSIFEIPNPQISNQIELVLRK